MHAKILDGKAMSLELREKLARRVEKLKEQGYLTIAGKLPRRYFESLIAGGRSPGHGKETENVRG